ncbi:MAG: hypothetical protein WC637_20455 [Victivallales bacterium]|jgi:hypothetical protein
MGKNKISFLTDLAIVLVISLALLSGLVFSGDWPQSHDSLRYLCHLDQFKDAFDSGILYPRWMPNYYGGYGYPVFVFYQPAYFFFSLLFTYIAPDILAASYASNVAIFFIGGAGIYMLIRKIAGDRVISVFSSVMFLLTPYVYVNLFVRGDLSELLAMFVAPWTLYFLIGLREKIAEKAAFVPHLSVLALALAAMVYSHPFTSMFFYPLFCAIAVSLCLEMQKRDRAVFLSSVAAALICSVIFSSPYWFTAFQMKKFVAYSSAVSGFFSAENHVVYFSQLFSRAWGFGGSGSGLEDDMSFQLGLPHFILALSGFWLNRRNRLYLTVFMLYVFCILMMSPLASFLWKNIPLMNFVQFPWRLLSVIALLQVVCISGIWKLGPLVKTNMRFYSLVVLFLVFTLVWNSREFEFIKFNIDLRTAVERHRTVRLEKLQVYESFNEFLPKTAASRPPTEPRGNRPMLLVSDLTCRIAEYPENNPHHMRYSISTEKPQLIMINQLYFPGWKIILGDRELDASTLLNHISKDGRIQIDVPAGENIYLEAFYEGPPGWYARNMLIGIVFMLMLAAIMLEQRKHLRRALPATQTEYPPSQRSYGGQVETRNKVETNQRH